MKTMKIIENNITISRTQTENLKISANHWPFNLCQSVFLISCWAWTPLVGSNRQQKLKRAKMIAKKSLGGKWTSRIWVLFENQASRNKMCVPIDVVSVCHLEWLKGIWVMPGSTIVALGSIMESHTSAHFPQISKMHARCLCNSCVLVLIRMI